MFGTFTGAHAPTLPIIISFYSKFVNAIHKIRTFFYVCTNLHSGVYSKLSKPEHKFDRCNRIVRKLQYYVIIVLYRA